ncbi:MAG: aminotransferase class V-fold PLP-dependent enzyme [Bacteroidetes bacterium]|nr:aminotransferase class V-fold PLP-dependent enzyme [Bacteroidota bacterium]
MNISQLRAETPGCAERIHLNNSGSSLMPDPVLTVIRQYIDLESRIGGYEAHAAMAGAFDDAYRAVAQLVGSSARNIAFTESATVSFAQAVSSVPFERGDIILTTRNDYNSNQIQFLSLRDRLGVAVVRAPDGDAGGVDVGVMEEMIRGLRPRLVSVTHVPTNSGLVQDVTSIGSVCREEGVLYLVDACQSVGQMPVDVAAIGCDFLSATSRKFLRGPRGSGFLFVSDRVLDLGLAPLFPDLRGAEWVEADRYELADSAIRFETWESYFALILGTAEAARYAMSIGLESIQQRVRLLADGLRERLARIDGVRLLDRGAELAAIVSCEPAGHDPAEVVAALRKRGINLSAQSRTAAVIDNADKGVTASLRLSPHYYNTEEEIEAAVDALRHCLSE